MSDYLLGHDELEWQRLQAQHLVWRDSLLDLLEPNGISRGASILEVGCGSGALLRDLALHVGDKGRVLGVEIDPRAVEKAQQDNVDLAWVEVQQGDLNELRTQDRFDLVVARWVLSFVSGARQAVEALAARLNPGGLLLVQDYSYDAIRMVPRDPGLERLFQVTPQAYELGGGNAWLALELPAIYGELGLQVVMVDPRCKAGPPDSGVFNWAERFFLEHLHKFVDQGLLSEKEAAASRRGWANARKKPHSIFYSPLVVSVLGRRSAEAAP